MKLVANFWFRVFAGAFLIGCLITWPIFDAWLFSTTQELRTLSSEQGYPVQVVTNPLVDLHIPGQQPIALNSFWSAIFISVFGGLIAGISALIFAALYRLLFGKRLIKKLS